jgi:hypothetical protein
MSGTSRRRGAFWTLSLVVTGLVGLLMVVGGLLPDVAVPARIFLLVMGAFLLFTVVRWVRLYLRPPVLADAVTSTTLDGRPAVAMRLRPDVPINALVATGLAAGALWGAGAWYLLAREGNPALPWLLALVITWFVPDAARAAVQGGAVTASPSTIQVRAWDATSRLDWDDVASVDVEQNGGRSVLRIVARAGATSWHTERRRWLKRYDPRPPEGSAEVFLLALAMDRTAFIAAMVLWHRDRAARADIGSPQTVLDLGGGDPRPQDG